MKKKKKTTKINTKKQKVKKKRIRFGRVFLALIILALFIFIFSKIVSFPLKSIYIYNNKILSDQEIIDIAGLNNYPSFFELSDGKIKKRLGKNIYIDKVKIKRKYFREIHLFITENRPLFYNSSLNKTVFSNKKNYDSKENVPILINYIPDTIYKDFVKVVSELDEEILNKISEIKYDPNAVDDERFFLFMDDGNYVYLTLDKFDKINNYVSIMKQVLQKYDNTKGTLYLDEGEYFEISRG